MKPKIEEDKRLSIHEYIFSFLILIFCGHGLMAQTDSAQKPEPAEGTAIFLDDDKLITDISCGNFHKLMVKFSIPDHIGTQYDRVKFVLKFDDEELKTRNYTKSEIPYMLSGKKSRTFIIASGDTSDFSDGANRFLTSVAACQLRDAQKKVTGYKVQALGYGYKIEKVVNGKPKYSEPEIFSSGNAYLSLGSAEVITEKK